jgi:hypothetical protein
MFIFFFFEVFDQRAIEPNALFFPWVEENDFLNSGLKLNGKDNVFFWEGGCLLFPLSKKKSTLSKKKRTPKKNTQE